MARPLTDPNDERTYRAIRITSTLQAAKTPEVEILAEVRCFGFGEEDIFAIKLALEEAMTNAVKHGNCNDASKTVTVQYAVDDRSVVIIVRDDGCGFQPESVPDPTTADRICLPNGRGLMLMRAYMDFVEYRRNGCEVRMVKNSKK